MAEDLTPPADYASHRTSRSLVDLEDPAVRGSALWFAHSVMASFHQDASDRQTAYRRTARQEIKYAASPPAVPAWLASRMSTWPERYRSKCWLNPQLKKIRFTWAVSFASISATITLLVTTTPEVTVLSLARG